MEKKKNKFLTAGKVLGLTVATFGIYGAYFMMKNMFPEDDINTDETEKDADNKKRAMGAAWMMNHFSRM